jgi:hypothetical protein
MSMAVAVPVFAGINCHCSVSAGFSGAAGIRQTVSSGAGTGWKQTLEDK